MIKYFKNLQLRKLMIESTDAISVFERLALRLGKINEKLFGLKNKRQLEIDELHKEILMIDSEVIKNNRIKNKINRFLND